MFRRSASSGVGREGQQVLGDRKRLSGERGLGDLESGAVDQARVRGDGIARGEHEDVAGDDLARLEDLLPSVPNHARLVAGEPSQGFQGLFRASA